MSMADKKEKKEVKTPKKEEKYSGELKEIYDRYIKRGWTEEKVRKFIEDEVKPSRE